MVDWSLARQVARLAAGSGEVPGADPDIAAVSAEMEAHVAAYTRLRLATPVPGAELVSREEWAQINLETLSGLLDPVAERLEGRMDFAGPLAGVLKAGAAATLAAEAGLVMGYLSQRVIGQYEVSLLSGEAPPRLLFVAPNLRKAVRELEVEADAFHRWIAAHELTHVFQFQGVPWLREHLSGMVREYLSTVDVRIERGAAGGLPSMPNLGRLVDTFREGGLAALVQTREQQELMARMQATMAVVEGYSEHVMDEIAREAIPDHEKLRTAMDARRRSRSAPQRIVERLLGFDVKLRQYELGKRFCDAVAASAGIEGLNRVWESPEALPSAEELEAPEAWLQRLGPTPAAAA
ncbi:MAG TPA: zinc-dependent metalloprotease [Thermoleophilaceae bacterium]|nr:zinc-dependent metalloprotease [Thermoleophilaceae bacterium]